MTTYDMTNQTTVDQLNNRTAELMREHGWNAEQALDKVLHELRIAGAQQITETDPDDTNGGYIQLYRLADGKHINMGFDDQELEWDEEDGE